MDRLVGQVPVEVRLQMIDAAADTRRDQKGEDGVNGTVLHEGKRYDGSTEGMGVNIPKDLCTLLLLNCLPLEYQLFSRTQIGRDELLLFLELEARLLDEEIQLKLDAKKDGDPKALYLRKGKQKSSAKVQTSISTQPDKKSSQDDNNRRSNHRGREQ
jgi:hypothetical protein